MYLSFLVNSVAGADFVSGAAKKILPTVARSIPVAETLAPFLLLKPMTSLTLHRLAPFMNYCV
jgi:hypothetical protein